MENVLGFTFSRLKEYFSEHGLKPFVANQVYDWVYQKNNLNIEEWSNISKKNKPILKNILSFEPLKIVFEQKSKQGTVKFLFGLEDSLTIESVLIKSNERLTICISTQVGCAIGCTFCHTGTQGLTRNLTAAEIVSQFWMIKKWVAENNYGSLTNIVYMGQGEPLHNFEHSKTSAIIFMEERGFGIGQRKITLSTSGLIPQLKKFVDFPPINLAISLHAAFDAKRTELMPINKNFNIEDLLKTLDELPLKGHRRITFEYLVIKDFNDSYEDAVELAKVLKKSRSKINLIPFNEYPGSIYQKPTVEQLRRFQKYLLDFGFTCTIRYSKGDDILAACGQLKSKVEEKTSLTNLVAPIPSLIPTLASLQ
jgi:23S rRNA (adenine2503-C2)-methyltransferase